jgi:hypothetical protein
VANPATLATLRTRCRQRADKVNSTFVSDAEVNELINQAISELHGILVTFYEDYVLTTASLTITENVEYTALPTDIFKPLAVFLTDTAGNRYKLNRFNLEDLAPSSQSSWPWSASPATYAYRVAGNRVYWYPKPISAATAEIWYAPQFTRLVADGDVINVAYVDGWDEFIVNDVAMKIRLKEEGDANSHMQMKAAFLQRLKDEAASRDAFRPMRVVDVERIGYNPDSSGRVM